MWLKCLFISKRIHISIKYISVTITISFFKHFFFIFSNGSFFTQKARKYEKLWAKKWETCNLILNFFNYFPFSYFSPPSIVDYWISLIYLSNLCPILNYLFSKIWYEKKQVACCRNYYFFSRRFLMTPCVLFL